MRLFASALVSAILAFPAAYPGELRAEPSLSVKASLAEGDPGAATLTGWAAELAGETGWTAGVELLGPGALAGARTAMADPDGLTIGFLTLDEAVTRPLQDLAPYRAEEFQPAVLFPGGAPVLVGRPDSPAPDLARLVQAPDRTVKLLAPNLMPVPGPTLMAAETLTALGAELDIRELHESARRHPDLPEGLGARDALWVSAYLALTPGELLALPWEGLQAVRKHGLSPATVLVLAAPPSAGSARMPFPEGPGPGDLGIAPGVRELFGFYYPAETGDKAKGGAPGMLAAMAARALAAPQDFPFVTGPALAGDGAREAFEAETAARRSVLESLSLAGEPPAPGKAPPPGKSPPPADPLRQTGEARQ
ncbi:MAG: hypothetical protein LBQ79_13610 [Deltaproteobacteria bacterium]|jgi:hypothetical protein|nr:hypothetical protein [Deltaproteobacteria bacterium]